LVLGLCCNLKGWFALKERDCVVSIRPFSPRSARANSFYGPSGQTMLW